MWWQNPNKWVNDAPPGIQRSSEWLALQALRYRTLGYQQRALREILSPQEYAIVALDVALRGRYPKLTTPERANLMAARSQRLSAGQIREILAYADEVAEWLGRSLLA